MSLRQKVNLEFEDGHEIEVVYDGRDLRAWESAFDRSALAESVSVSMLSWLGWSAAKRNGLLNGTGDNFADFDKVCVSVQGVREDEAARPTKRKGRTPSSPGDDSSAP